MQDYNKLIDEIQKNIQAFSNETPTQMEAFHKLMQAEEGGVVDRKTKELISVACAVTAHCEWCIAFHVKAALDAGAKRKEILESAWVGVVMGGGPALMYSQGVLKALDTFSGKG